ncbi:hypothetical protein ACG2LH_18260, partial [Zhouia sp. PK063]|uniref:hypothetical protein n=1 Tax=Zhouia sp. PK063 TaxID=3373602 RepID=UPI00379E0DE2
TKVIANRAETKILMGNLKGVENELKRTLKIRREIGDSAGVSANYLQFSKYYISLKDTAQAIHYAKKASELSKRNNYNDNFKIALNQLSLLDSKNATAYFQEYKNLNDSLILAERKHRNKLGRIRYETDKYISESNILKKKIGNISIGILISSLIIILIAVLIFQRVRNNRLRLEQKQKEANAEILHLMVAENSKVE